MGSIINHLSFEQNIQIWLLKKVKNKEELMGINGHHLYGESTNSMEESLKKKTLRTIYTLNHTIVRSIFLLLGVSI